EGALANGLDVLPALGQRRPRTVEAAVAKHDPLEPVCTDDALFEMSDRGERTHGVRGRTRVEGCILVLHHAADLRVRPAGEALRNELLPAGRSGGREEGVG